MAAGTPTQPPETPVSVEQPTKNLVLTLSDGTKVKRRVPRQRACNEPGSDNKRGNICAGHLKRWHGFGEEVKQRFGANAEIYRCEHCHTLYLPDEQEPPRTLILRY